MLARSTSSPSTPRVLHCSPSHAAYLYLYVGSQAATQASCTSSYSYTLYHVPNVPTGQVFVESFPTPLVVPHPATGAKNCLYAFITSAAAWTVNGSGFLGQ